MYSFLFLFLVVYIIQLQLFEIKICLHIAMVAFRYLLILQSTPSVDF